MEKSHRTDLVIFSHSTERKTLSYSRINTEFLFVMNKRYLRYFGASPCFVYQFYEGTTFVTLGNETSPERGLLL